MRESYDIQQWATLQATRRRARGGRRALGAAVVWASLVTVVLIIMLVLGWPKKQTSIPDRAPWACVAELHDGTWVFSPGCHECDTDTNCETLERAGLIEGRK